MVMGGLSECRDPGEEFANVGAARLVLALTLAADSGPPKFDL